MGAPAIHSYATTVREALQGGKKTHKNADGCNASYIEDEGRVNYNSREARVEISDEGPIVVFERDDPDDPGTESFRIENGEVIRADGSRRPLEPVETFELPDGGKMTVETEFPEDGGQPVSKVTITNTERNGRNHLINALDWNNNFGLQVANIGGRGALEIETGSGKKMDKAVDDGEVNGSNLGFSAKHFGRGVGESGRFDKGGGPDVDPFAPLPPIYFPPPDIGEVGGGGDTDTPLMWCPNTGTYATKCPSPAPAPKPKPLTPEEQAAWAERARLENERQVAHRKAEWERLLAGPDAAFIERFGYSKFMPEPTVGMAGATYQMLIDSGRHHYGDPRRPLSDEAFMAKYGFPKPPPTWGHTSLEVIHYDKTGEILTPEEIWNQAALLDPKKFRERYGYEKPGIPPLDLLRGPPASHLSGRAANIEVAKLFRNTPLFMEGRPSRDDIYQGGAGDCSLLAALSGLAETQPGLIQDNLAVHQGPPAYFEVTLYEHPLGSDADPDAPGVPRTILLSVDEVKRFSVDTGQYAEDVRSMWPSVYAAAYQKMQVENGGGHSKIEAIAPEDAYYAVTGGRAESFDLTGDLMPYLQSSLAAGRTATIYTQRDDIGPPRSSDQEGPDGITGLHAYEVVGIEQSPDGAEPVFVLRNPHGPAGTSDGNIRIPVSQLVDSTAEPRVTIAAQPAPENTIARSPYQVVNAARGLDPATVNVGPLMTRDEQIRLGLTDAEVLMQARIPTDKESDILGGVLSVSAIDEIFGGELGEVQAVAAELLARMREYQGVSNTATPPQ